MKKVPEYQKRKRRSGQIDVDIGERLRALRMDRGLSQSALADGLGLTFQQVQKYEKGTNRVSAGRLARIAEILEAPMTYFTTGEVKAGRGPKMAAPDFRFIQRGSAVRLMKAFDAVPNRQVRYALILLTEALSGVAPTAEDH